MREVFALGIGMMKIGRFPDKTNFDMGRAGIVAAMKDAGIGIKDIQAGFFSNRDDVTPALGEQILGLVGRNGMPVVNLENASCSGSTAVWLAYNSVALGQYDVAMAFSTEQSPRGFRPPPTGFGSSRAAMGMAIIPAMCALLMRRRIKDFGETVEQYAQVAVKNRMHASLNPNAQYQKPITVEEVLDSRPIADPITLLHCCPTSEGAAAAILCSKDFAKKHANGPLIEVVTAELQSPESFSHVGLTSPGLSKRVCETAYEKAGLGIEDVDVVELHDPFTVNEIVHYEDLGLCEKGEGGRLAGEGVTALGGAKPVNTDGGLMSRGHPIGCTGIYQIGELVLQLRGHANGRQVPNAKTALAHLEGIGPIASAIILKR